MKDFFTNFALFNVNAFYEIMYFLLNNWIVIAGIVGIAICFIFEEIENRQTDILDERNII